MALLVLAGGVSKAHAARRYGVSAKIVARPVEHYQAEGPGGHDRSLIPSPCHAGIETGRHSRQRRRRGGFDDQALEI
jgi:hypothetical protein